MFSLLIRTSGRPKYFNKCYKSVMAQTYKDYRVIISIDEKRDLSYVRKCNAEIIRVKKSIVNRRIECPWDKYFNDLLKKATGWIIYLDDDVTMHPDALEKISKYCTDPENVIIWKYKWLTRGTMPEDEYWEKEPVRGHIDTGCFCHHINQSIQWLTLGANDWRVVKQLWDRGLKFHWINEVLFEAGNDQLEGRQIDAD